jgi:hypothetical protein
MLALCSFNEEGCYFRSGLVASLRVLGSIRFGQHDKLIEGKAVSFIKGQ